MVMAQIDVLIGKYDAAIDELETLLSIQNWYTTTYMQADPLLDPLKELPRFKALMEKYERQESTH
jgi:hypothetical protein